MSKNKEKETKTEEKVTVKSLKLQNSLLLPLRNILDVRLPGCQARARNRFMSLIEEQIAFLDKERRRLYSEAANKDEAGKPKTKTEVDQNTKQAVEVFDISPEAAEAVKIELLALYAEEFVIDILPSNKFDITVVTNAVLNTTKEFGLSDGYTYDLIAKAFEATKE